MIAIAVSSFETRYIIWDRREDEVRLVSCQVLPWDRAIDSFRDVARIREILQRIFAETEEATSSSVYISLDAQFCHFSTLEVDPSWDTREQLDFLTAKRLGDESLYASFQYPLSFTEGLYLNVDCPRVLRRAFQSVLPETDSTAHLLSIGVFSVYNYAKRVVPALERGRRLFWRVSETSPDQFLEIEDGEFRALHFFERSAENIRPVRTVGPSQLQEPIIAYIGQLIEGQEAVFPEVESVFVYLGSGTTGFLEQILQSEQSTLSLLNPFWRWNWPDLPGAEDRYTQSAFAELADAIWVAEYV